MNRLRLHSQSRQPKSFQFVAVKAAQKGAKARKKGQNTGKKVFLTILGIIFGIFVLSGIVGAVLVTGYIGTINASLPDAGKLATQDLEQSTKIFDRNGKLLYTVYGDINREFVALENIPEKTQWALLAAEDVEFYEHKGIDIIGIISAGVDYIRSGTQRSRGASTITQQLARNTVLFKVLGSDAYNRDLNRKLKEMLVAFQLESKLTKDQILELYMNEVPLGGPVYGFQTASKAYFNKDISKLTLAESAMLSVVVRAPGYYSNSLYNAKFEEIIFFRNIVLDNMLKHRDKTGVTPEEIEAAKAEEIVITPGKVDITAPHFVFYVIQLLEQQYGSDAVRAGGLRVYTTLDLETQKIAEEELRKHINNVRNRYKVHNGSVVINNPKNGEILAMVGSVDYNNTKDKRIDGKVNVAVMPRQMGSSVKPYTYLEAFHRGYNPGTLAPDIKMTFGAYRPENWNFRYDGLMTMRRALNQSRNLPAVYTLQLIGGTEVFLEAAEKLGITTLTQKERYGLSLTLGAGDMKLIEHTNAFATFANKGVKHDITTILRITDSKDNELFKSNPQATAKRVYTEEEVYLLNWVMCMIGGDRDKHVPQYYAAAGQTLCGKTGTTNDQKDLVTLLYYPRLTVGVWNGNNNGDRTTGWSENVPIIVANNIMKRLVPKYGKEFYTQPSGVTFTAVCTDTGLGATGDVDCKKFSTPIIRGKGPPADNAHKKLPICTKTGKIPSNEAEARAAGLVKDTLYLDFKLPNSAQQAAYDKYVTETLKYKLWKNRPDEAPCIPDVTIAFVTPNEGTTYIPNQAIAASVTASSVDGIATVVFTIGTDTYPSVFADGKYTCIGCKVPLTASPGTLTITAKATDNSARIGTATRNITVILPTVTPSGP
ncbi:MAG: transglycosylase domain-containing protein [Candidatus Dojkabacteria bacterium]|nr:MAG: transglycosylase domain-containing protein [Candidatus Dojkabacteria bacterium]